MSDKFTVEIISPDRAVLKSDAIEVTIPSYEGQMGILKDHIPLITFLRPGFISIKNQNEKDKYNHGKDLAGDVTEELFLSKEVLEKSGWLKFLSTCVYKWIEIETGKKITNV